jgi:hypothetical protein
VELILWNKRNKSLRTKGTNNYIFGNKKRTTPIIIKKYGTIFLEQEEQVFHNKRNNIREQKRTSPGTKKITKNRNCGTNFMQQEEQISQNKRNK